MFFNFKMEEYMEFEASGIFRVKVVTKNIVSVSLGTHFMHKSVKKSYCNFMMTSSESFKLVHT